MSEETEKELVTSSGIDSTEDRGHVEYLESLLGKYGMQIYTTTRDSCFCILTNNQDTFAEADSLANLRSHDSVQELEKLNSAVELANAKGYAVEKNYGGDASWKLVPQATQSTKPRVHKMGEGLKTPSAFRGTLDEIIAWLDTGQSADEWIANGAVDFGEYRRDFGRSDMSIEVHSGAVGTEQEFSIVAHTLLPNDRLNRTQTETQILLGEEFGKVIDPKNVEIKLLSNGSEKASGTIENKFVRVAVFKDVSIEAGDQLVVDFKQDKIDFTITIEL